MGHFINRPECVILDLLNRGTVFDLLVEQLVQEIFGLRRYNDVLWEVEITFQDACFGLFVITLLKWGFASE